MKVDGCETCLFLPQNNPVIETENWAVTLSPDQGYLGRCYVTLKEHKEDLADLTNEEWLEFGEVVKKLEKAIRLAFNAQVFNWGCLMNNAFQHSPAKPHVHWHMRPRYDQTVSFDGIDFTDPLFGHHYGREHSQKVSDETLEHIRNTIKENIR